MKGSRSPGRMKAGAPTSRVTAWDYQRATRSSRSRRAGRCAASGQPPHESDKNASVGPPPFPCATTVRPAPRPDKHISRGGQGGLDLRLEHLADLRPGQVVPELDLLRGLHAADP